MKKHFHGPSTEGNSGEDMQPDEINVCTGGYFTQNTNIVRPLPDYTESMYGMQEKTEQVYNMRSS